MLTKEENILPLITAYLSNELTANEHAELKAMLLEEEYEQIFLEHVAAYRNSRQINFVQTIDVNKAWEKTVSKVSHPLQNAPHIKSDAALSYKSILKYAAIFIFLLTGTYFLSEYFTASQPLTAAVKGEENIVITMADGTKKIINSNSKSSLKNSSGAVIASQSGNSATYGGSSNYASLQYNTISIPYGKKFTLFLSDGTKVELNAGSTLRYPEEFIKQSANREVYVTGEAYFEVSKDTKHPFLVHSNTMDVKVLGTHFNFRSYSEEKSSSVVLLEGAVEVKSASGDAVNLKPDEMGVLDKNSNSLNKEEVFARNYTAWVDGQLIFRKVPLDIIIRALERHFNVEIENQSTLLNKSLLNANFGSDNLEKVMKYMQDDFGLKYKVKNNKIIIY
ncbi:FecR family protein [Flavobacterium luteolum]|uniref:FecR family protein n=1 Tax=Flavobacterium luteolum TaxID=3003259 RepID=UPI00248EEAB2|nr:FecR domain-containing protein [Flavobacterium luteolum]